MDNSGRRTLKLVFSVLFILCAFEVRSAPVQVTFTQSNLVTTTEQLGTAGSFSQVSPTATNYTINVQFKFFLSGPTFADPALGTASGLLYIIPGSGCDVADYASFPSGGIALLGDPSSCTPGTYSNQIASAQAAGAAGTINITSINDVTFLNLGLTNSPSIPGLFVSSAVGDALLAILNDTPPPDDYTVGGAISGLVGSVTLQNNGGDNLVINTNGGFTFATPLASGSGYAVSVLAQPSGQTCSVTNGVGSVTSSDISNVVVNCIDDSVIPSPTDAKRVPALSVYTLAFTILGLLYIANRHNHRAGKRRR